MDLITPDSSVLIPALVAWHESHDAAAAALRGRRLRLIGHVMLETYSTLTGRVTPRIHPTAAAAALTRLEPDPLLLSAAGYRRLLDSAGRAGVIGGQVHDARLAATAAEHGLRLLSRDVRAARAYQAMGADYELL